MNNILNFDSYNLLFVFGAALSTQVLFFLIAAAFKTDKVTDLAYGSTFALISLLLLFTLEKPELLTILMTTMVAVWGIRLSGYLFYRILKIKKDNRFDNIRNDVLKFASFWVLQTVAITIIMIPTAIILSKNPAGITNLGILGAIIWLIGFIIESIADYQKFVFKQNKNNKGKWIASGLWKYSRHPNYFGEILCWWGIYLSALPFMNGLEYLSIISPVFITFLLLFVSGVPTLEKKYDARYADNKEYQEYKNNTHLILPLP